MPKRSAPDPMKTLKQASEGDVGHIDKKGKTAGPSKAEIRATLFVETVESKIRSMCELVDCSPTVSDIAFEIFVTSKRDKLFGPNTPLDPTTAAYVLEASRRSLQTLSFGELSRATGVNKHEISRYHKELIRYFMRKTVVDGDFHASSTVQGPSEPLELRFIRRYCRSLGLSKQATALATQFGQVAHSEMLMMPSDIAASTVLFATAVAGDNKGVGDVGTISNRSTRQLVSGFEKLRCVKGPAHESFVDAVMSIYGIERQAACKKLYEAV
ncbi:hypothetical protein FRB95_013970 [Tulasnella sp. JGI-2019a]|nr:hypothetical protein FRB95_013970 [Tulasnella sp. JGI-2019a]